MSKSAVDSPPPPRSLSSFPTGTELILAGDLHTEGFTRSKADSYNLKALESKQLPNEFLV